MLIVQGCNPLCPRGNRMFSRFAMQISVVMSSTCSASKQSSWLSRNLKFTKLSLAMVFQLSLSDDQSSCCSPENQANLELKQGDSSSFDSPFTGEGEMGHRHFLWGTGLPCTLISYALITVPGAGHSTSYLLHPIFSVNLEKWSGFNNFTQMTPVFNRTYESLFPIAQSTASHTTHLLPMQNT
jgi:hypothetical protein